MSTETRHSYKMFKAPKGNITDGHHFGMSLLWKDSAVDQTRIYSALRVSSFPKAMYMKLSEGLHMWEPGQRQTGVLFRAFPWVPTRDSDCLDWWFGMSSGSEGTIIHRGQGHRWTAFLTTLLRLVILLGPHPPCHHYTDHIRYLWLSDQGFC